MTPRPTCTRPTLSASEIWRGYRPPRPAATVHGVAVVHYELRHPPQGPPGTPVPWSFTGLGNADVTAGREHGSSRSTRLGIAGRAWRPYPSSPRFGRAQVPGIFARRHDHGGRSLRLVRPGHR